MATHSNILAWKIPWMEEPGGLQSKGSQRAGHDWETSLSLFTIIYGLYYVEVGSFYAHFLKSFNHKWVLNFVKGFFCIYWDYNMILSFNLLIWCIILIIWCKSYWFAYIEESLHSWNNPNLILVNELFDVLLNSLC